jgi:hypothetical protein
MRKPIRSSFLGVMIALSVFTGCKKDQTDPKSEYVSTNNLTQNDYAGAAEVDEVVSNVNDIISNLIGGGQADARIAEYKLPCGVVKLDSVTEAGGKKTYKLKYGEQSTCGYEYKKKSGEVSFKLESGTHFNTADARFIINFTDYTVQSAATGQHVIINGTLAITNLTGGYIWQVILPSDHTLFKNTLTHSVRGKLMVTFANGAVRERNYFQRRNWKSTSGWAGLKLTISGDSTITREATTYTGIYETGKTLDGNFEYFSTLEEDFIWSNCGTTWAGPFVLAKGKAKVNVDIPGVSPAYFDVQGGFKYNISEMTATPVSEDAHCEANAYKITIELGSYHKAEHYQLY